MSLKERLVRFRTFWIYPLIAVALLYFTFKQESQSDIRDLIWLFPLGVAGWTLLEYGLHRFVFHTEVENPRLREVINASHVNHHAAPRDADKLFVRTGYGLVVSALIFGALYKLFGNAASAAGMMSGIWAGFLYYECVHYRVHLTSANRRLIARQRRAHFYHHFTDNSRCFGVTTPLWDYIFRTQLPSQPR
jgi:sterol desaturase/sphingolipid hydroxylase (fatty acid hydroxylase superfamily)